jgi:hypothetical protein
MTFCSGTPLRQASGDTTPGSPEAPRPSPDDAREAAQGGPVTSGNGLPAINPGYWTDGIDPLRTLGFDP